MQPDATQAVRSANLCDKFPFGAGDQGGHVAGIGSIDAQKRVLSAEVRRQTAHPRPRRVLGFNKLVPITYLTGPATTRFAMGPAPPP
ncbi:hypothetical protein Amn_11150 [Aminobacter sp. Y103A]|nr:hypothetical protein Amn_11150 [Aminobacter sp. SS-2016]